ncbi:MAG: hypothetical protein WAM66_00045 [Acidobacteriaceae bacterium]
MGVPDGEIEVVRAFSQVDALVKGEGTVRELVKFGFVEVEADAGAETGDNIAVAVEGEHRDFQVNMLFAVHRYRRELVERHEKMTARR